MNHPLTIIAFIAASLAGCNSAENPDRDFHTSGSREADQRAEQRIARDQQLKGESMDSDSTKAALFKRLGGEAGIEQITADFLDRALADPRVNWERKGVKSGGFLRMGRESETWDPNSANRETLKKHFVQFLTLATGGPAKYDGRDMKQVHEGMAITNAEYDAAIGDLKATLDARGVGIDEQKELIAIIESARPQVVEER